MNKNNAVVALVVAVSIAITGFSIWRKWRSNKHSSSSVTEVSLDGPISDSDKKAKPTKAQCERYVDDDIARMEPSARDGARVVRGSRVSDCQSKFTIAALKCMRDAEADNKVLNDMTDPYGCVAANPRK